MKTFKDLVQNKLGMLREERQVSDDIHSWALLSYLLEKLKNYLMDDEGREENFEADNREILNWLSYIAAMAQHSAEQLQMIQREEHSHKINNKEHQLFTVLDNILKHITVNKVDHENPPQKNKKWFTVPFSEDHIKDLGIIVGNYKRENE